MVTTNLILVDNLCSHYKLEFSFFDRLNEIGLIEIRTVEQVQFIEKEQLTDLEKIIRIQNDLDVNVEGIDVIFNLLQKVEQLNHELKTVKNKLMFYEGEL